MYEIKGKVYKVGNTQQVTEKFKKRELTLFVENERNIQYSDYISLEVSQDGCEKLDGLKKDQLLECKFFVNGRKYEKDGTERFFNTLKLIDFSILTESAHSQDYNAPASGTADPLANFPDDPSTDLPF